MALRHPITDPELKRICGQPDNKVCADCEALAPPYVDLDHGVFICSNCCAVHKELGFRIKGVQMSFFTPDDVQLLLRHGNRIFNEKYLAKLTAEEITELPSSHRDDRSHLAGFIRMKYIDRKWFSGSGGENGTSIYRNGTGTAPGSSNNSATGAGPDAYPPVHLMPTKPSKSIVSNVLNNRSFYRGSSSNNAATSGSSSVPGSSRASPNSPLTQGNEDTLSPLASRPTSQVLSQGLSPNGGNSSSYVKPPIHKRSMSSNSLLSTDSNGVGGVMFFNDQLPTSPNTATTTTGGGTNSGTNSGVNSQRNSIGRQHSYTGQGYNGVVPRVGQQQAQQSPYQNQSHRNSGNTSAVSSMYNTVNSGYNTVNSPPPAPEMRRSQSWTPQPDPNHSPINSHSGYNGSGAQQQQHSPYGSGQTVRALTNMYTEAANRTPQLDRPPGMQQNPVLIQLCEEIDALKRALSMEQRDKKELDAKLRDTTNQLRETKRTLAEQEQLLAVFQDQSQSNEKNLQSKVDLYKAKPDALSNLSIQECDMLERELTQSIQKIREYKDYLNTRSTLSSMSMDNNNANNCIICNQGPKQVVFLPCRHMCMCQLCSNAMPRAICPICRGIVSGKMNVFS